MEINIKNIGVKDASRVMVCLSLLMQDSTERGNLDTEIYAGVFEILSALAIAIENEMEVSA